MRLVLILVGLLSITREPLKTVAYVWRPVRVLDRNAPVELRFAQSGQVVMRTVGVGAFAPETVVRSFAEEAGRAVRIEFSLDEGLHWRPTPSSPPETIGGAIATSADGRVWVCEGKDASYRTEDYGFVWTICEGLPAGASVVAGRTSPLLFFALDLQARALYVSTDGAKTFRGSASVLPNGIVTTESTRLFSTPGRSGDLWIAGAGGLYHASPARPFSKLPGIEEVKAFCFGLGTPGTEGAALFIAGTVDGVIGIFRSEDEGRSWVRLGEAPPWSRISDLKADPKKPGRLYARADEGLYVGNSR